MKSFKRLLSVLVLFTLLLSLFTFSSCKKQKPVSTYRLSVTYSDGEIVGKLRYKFVNTYNLTFDNLTFNLFANAYREGAKNPPVLPANENKAYPNGKSYGSTEILEVTQKGKKLEYQTVGEDGEFLKVETGTIYQDETKEIEITFKTTLPNSLLRLGITDLTVNIAEFFPLLCPIENGGFRMTAYPPFGDPYSLPVANFYVDLTLPSVYSVASSGFPTKTEISENGTTYSYELPYGRDFSLVLSENFEIRSIKTGDITVNYYSLGGNCDEKVEMAKDCVNFFTKTFGSLPYKSVTICESPFIHGGMEYSGLCLISSSLSGEDYRRSLVHEIAHQWWRCGVGNDEYSSSYLDEGLAEYSTYLYFSEKGEKSVANSMISTAKSAYKSFFDLNSLLSGSANTTMERSLGEFTGELEYVNVAYNKSLLLFHSYGETVGKNKAVKNLKKLYKDNYLDQIDLQKLVKALGLKEHFESYAYGKVLI